MARERGLLVTGKNDAEGPEPHEIVKRFLWFLDLTDDEARTSAATVR